MWGLISVTGKRDPSSVDLSQNRLFMFFLTWIEGLRTEDATIVRLMKLSSGKQQLWYMVVNESDSDFHHHLLQMDNCLLLLQACLDAQLPLSIALLSDLCAILIYSASEESVCPNPTCPHVWGEATSDGQECGNVCSLQTTTADPHQLVLMELQWLMHYDLFT